MKNLQSIVLYLITVGALVLITLYGPPLLEVKTPSGSTVTIWGLTNFIPLFTLARKNPDKDNSPK
ncbi:hypothetical protein ACOSZE_09140 [Lysinibacillus fusiformis]|uniref:hypothetical protein n=1 Tax=Lysinibacillus fusiformis TaxID=28031 RepID=UPI003B9F6954